VVLRRTPVRVMVSVEAVSQQALLANNLDPLADRMPGSVGHVPLHTRRAS